MSETSENRIQQEIFTYHWNKYPEERGLLFMVHNAGSSRINGARLKSMGMVKGVSDMIYLKPDGSGPMFIEIKTPKGRQSEAQKTWEDTLTDFCYDYHVVRSLEQMKQLCGWT